MKLFVVKETAEAERRVAATPDTVKKLADLGFSVTVESEAGAGADFSDSAYREAGAEIAEDRAAALGDADVVMSVRGLQADEAGSMKAGAILLGLFNPFQSKDRIRKYAEAKIIGFSMEFIPRITRAQSMDVLSSQANLAGYKAVLDATEYYNRAMPMMMTAAGTIAPARVMVMGAGVAGLQAIATARRLGGVVVATDVRLAAKEQVESLGGKFLMVESEEVETAETEGGYAKEMSENFKRQQAELIAETIRKQDIVITTALIPGRPAPELVSADMVRSMKPGSVIVDIAVEQGGNCALSEPGKVVRVDGVTIIGHLNTPSRLSRNASELYSKNLLNFLTPMVDQESKSLTIDWEDEIVANTVVTRDGSVVHCALTDKESA